MKNESDSKVITIIDYGMGNLGSIKNMLKRIGVESKITGDQDEIGKASKLILPGVGSFDAAMKRLNEGYRDILDRKVLEEKTPILGICLGMQLLTRGSEEGKLPGLGWIDAETIRFPQSAVLKVPHMGWNLVFESTVSRLTADLPEEPRFYFVHSYRVQADHRENSVLTANYGVTFDAAVQRDNIYGTQFHPEKSHKYGMKLLKNFAEI